MTSLTLVRRIAARPSIVFDALTTAEGIATWWGPDDGPVLAAQSDVRIGGDYLVRFRMQDGSEHEARGEYLEMVRPERVVMSFRWAFGGAPEEIGNISRVEMELRAIGDGTELTFTHANLIAATTPSATKPSHEQGWSVALDKLVRRLAGVAPHGSPHQRETKNRAAPKTSVGNAADVHAGSIGEGNLQLLRHATKHSTEGPD